MRSASRSPRPRHLLAGLACAGLVLIWHGWLLTNLPRGPASTPGARAVPPRAVQVRQIVSAPAPVPAPVEGLAAAEAPPPAARPVPLPARRAASPAPAAPATIAAAPRDADADAPAAAAPVYATRLSPPATLRYGLRRGAASGHAVLRWSPEGDRYEMTLQGDLPAVPSVAWLSHGGLDAHGIAPERYIESRRGRELRAANFQRDKGRITFSGPQVEYPLPPGAQDRLSWMLQLGAVLAADAGLEAPGQEVRLFVVGSRGDAEVWTFVVHGRDSVDLPGAGSVEALLLRREPRRLYDTLVEVWLDPARHHLPVRAEFTLRGDTTRFLLEQLTLP